MKQQTLLTSRSIHVIEKPTIKIGHRLANHTRWFFLRFLHFYSTALLLVGWVFIVVSPLVLIAMIGDLSGRGGVAYLNGLPSDDLFPWIVFLLLPFAAASFGFVLITFANWIRQRA